MHLEERYFDVIESKTKSGIRRVPIAEKVYPFFNTWFEDSDSEYLIHREDGKNSCMTIIINIAFLHLWKGSVWITHRIAADIHAVH